MVVVFRTLTPAPVSRRKRNDCVDCWEVTLSQIRPLRSSKEHFFAAGTGADWLLTNPKTRMAEAIANRTPRRTQPVCHFRFYPAGSTLSDAYTFNLCRPHKHLGAYSSA